VPSRIGSGWHGHEAMILGEMQHGESAPRPAGFINLILQTGRRYWPIGLIFAAIAVAALATYDIGRKVESWTAASTIVIGTLPTLDGVINSSTAVIAPIEGARDLVARIGNPQFQSSVISAAQKELENSRSLVAQGVVRGIVVDDSTIRLEASAPSREAAVVLLRQAILAVQLAHAQLLEPRMQFLHEVRGGLQAALKLLNDSFRAGSLKPAPAELSADLPLADPRPRDLLALGDPRLRDQPAPPDPRSPLDRIVSYRTHIAALNFIERNIVTTGPQGGFAPVIDGPREANLEKRALLTGLGILFFSVLLTLLLHMRSGRA
jgi:hypothetical protein